jgi:hypothetical protein
MSNSLSNILMIKILKKTVINILWILSSTIFPSTALSCSVNIVAFAGLDDLIDQRALSVYASKVDGCTRVYSWHQEGSHKLY